MVNPGQEAAAPTATGTPAVEYPGSERMREVFRQLVGHLERRYGIPVVVTDVTDPFTGDLDGQEIQIDHAEDAEASLFILVHLFGHTVQWNLSARAREIGSVVQAHPTPELLDELEAYELEACRYSLALLREVGITDFDQWLADYARCDFAYLRHFYATGEKAPFRQFWQVGTPVIDPLPIPAFTPRRWTSRWGGIVV
jgi:hypothetical protein